MVNDSDVGYACRKLLIILSNMTNKLKHFHNLTLDIACSYIDEHIYNIEEMFVLLINIYLQFYR